jgi:hypothetical protein
VPNLEENFIEVAEEGYLQIKEGYPWQIVQPPGEYFPNGSILWRIFRGFNERRQVIGKPLLSYQDAAFVPVEDITEARINVGANLQNAAFWRALETENFVPVVKRNEDNSSYLIALGTIEASSTITFYDSYAGGVDNRYNVAITPTQQGDALAKDKINAILRRMYAYRQAHVRFRAHYRTTIRNLLAIIGAGPITGCEGTQTLFADDNNPALELFGITSFASIGYNVGGFCSTPPVFNGCQTGVDQFAVANYDWPSNLDTENNKYVWTTVRGTLPPPFDIPGQASLTFQYNFSVPFFGSLNGVMDTRDVSPSYTNEQHWINNSAYHEDFVCQNPDFLRRWEGRKATHSIVADPLFSDLSQ